MRLKAVPSVGHTVRGNEQTCALSVDPRVDQGDSCYRTWSSTPPIVY